MNRKLWKRILMLMLSVVMTVTSIPVSASASEVVIDSEEVLEEVEEIAEETLPPVEEEPEEEDQPAVEEAPQEEEAPAEETPAEETPAEDAPAEEPEASEEEVIVDPVVPEEEPATPEEEPATPEEVPEEEVIVDPIEEEEEEPNPYGVEIEILDPLEFSADAASAVGLSVSVGRSDVVVTINAVGDSGVAQLYRYTADSYYTGDPLHGLSKNVNSNGELLCNYTCGTTQQVTFSRYRLDGNDDIYSKYYLVQNGKILAGPVYASEISSLRNVQPYEQKTKKGITMEDHSTLEIAKEMGVSNTVINMDLCDLIFRNEDENGNPIDNSRRSDAIEFECNGEMFYFNASYVQSQDGFIASYSKAGINVSLIVVAWAKTYVKDYPQSLLYLPASENRQTMGFNTSTERGRDYWIAAMEFLASRYTKSSKYGFVDKFIIGNEIDYTYDWYLIQPLKDANGKYQRAEFNTFMEEFARTFRLANLAVKKYNAGSKVCLSLTHNWAMDCYESYKYNQAIRKNSYAPKDILDWMSSYEKARGDYDWGMAVHPYPIGTTASNPIKGDIIEDAYRYPITGDWRTSPWVTAANLELYQLYLEQPVNRYKGQTRTVSITEGCVCSSSEHNVSAEKYRISTYEQAASAAMYYYRSACVDVIDAIAYFQPHDQSTYKLGLMQENGSKKPAYNVWKYVDTDKSFIYANKYLPYIMSEAKSYKDTMPVVKSEFNWDTKWDESKIIVRDISADDVTRSLQVNKSTFGANETILVTATGDVGDYVGLYKASDNILKSEPIYSYPLEEKVGGVKYKSGKTYDMIAYGEINSDRIEDAKLKAGNYKIALYCSDIGEYMIQNITISANYTMGSTSRLLKTNKTEYVGGEDIIVTAQGNTNCWVGLYKKDDKYGKGAVTSIYWYYVNDPEAGQISGKPTILQTTVHNTDSSNPAARIAAGEYMLYLFDGSGGNDYNVVASLPIKIVPGEVKPLKSIEYKLENATDGFANGVVTITKDASNEGATDCVMYWADANGKPLEGYTSLAKFRLEDTRTTFDMYSHTIIPEGAKKLIAYGTDGDVLSSTAVSVDLPANCTYKNDDKVLAEFQIVSDIHVTTDKGATGEVKLSNVHFTQLLEDVKKNSPDSLGIFINGDIANTGSELEYKKVYNLWLNANEDNTLPELHISIGNHDWMEGNPGKQFQKYATLFNSNLKSQPENVYYHENVGGYDFVYLGGEKAGLRAVMSQEQLQWFDDTMAEITKKDPEKPVFVFLHQALYNTVAGTLPGQGWDGVVNELAMKRIMRKYGQIILFGGHSHWELNSESCMYPGDEEMAVAFNTASLGYLWSSYDVIGGEFHEGSHGWYVRVYDDKVLFLGRSVEDGKFIPSAIFVVQKNNITTAQDVYDIALDKTTVNIGAASAEGVSLEYTSTNSSVLHVTEDGTLLPKKQGSADVIITAYGNRTSVISRKTVTVNVGEASVYRIYGKDRYVTSQKIADALKEQLGVNQFDTVVVASGKNFADALAGSYLANKKNAPILITNGTAPINTMLKDYIKVNLKKGGTVYILGGTNALPNSVVSGLTGFKVKRLAGANRYETNLAILKEAGVTNEDILICTGTNFADSLSASASKLPILLVGKDLTNAQRDFLAAHKGNNLYILGGTVAVSKKVENQIKTYGIPKRLAGATRYETSVLIAKEFFDGPKYAVLAYASNFPDGLCGGPLAASKGGPLLLVKTNQEIPAATYARETGVIKGSVLGGTGLIADYTARTVFNLDITTAIVEK